MSIKDKLSRLDRTRYEEGPAALPPIDSPLETWILEFQHEFGAKILQDRTSFIVLKENLYPFHQHPFFPAIQASDYVIPGFHQILGQDQPAGLQLRKTLFIDLETTGISGGTGTYAFLVGIGHLELDHLVVRQYLLPDFQYEWLLLQYINNSLLDFENIVSFNGKTFDIPLLRNRFVLNRMDSVLDDLNHIDVLHAARRLWKRRLSSCDLENLEFAVLGEERLHDVPGELIPQIYFEFIRKRRAVILRDVLEHNYYDITHMVLLTIKIGLDVSDPLKSIQHQEDLFSLARFYYRTGRYTAAIPLLENLQKSAGDELLMKETVFLLSMSHKKLGNFQTSVELFQQLLYTHRDHPEALEELAKYYEHQEKNFGAALELVNRGLEYTLMLEQLGKPTPLSRIKDAMMHRRHRLENRLRRQSLKNDTPDGE